jgi:hypothetical protein
MPPSTEALYEKALELFARVPDNFFDLGRVLRQLQDRDPDLFQKFVAKTGIGRRKAYYLVEISRTFDPLQVSRARLHDLGWTKVQLLGKHVTKDNVEELLKLAENTSANELERVLSGKKPLGKFQKSHDVVAAQDRRQLARRAGVRDPFGDRRLAKRQAVEEVQRADDLIERSPGCALRRKVDLIGPHVLQAQPIGRAAEIWLNLETAWR